MDEISIRQASPISCASCSSRCSSASSLVVDNPRDPHDAGERSSICQQGIKIENPPLATITPLDLSRHPTPREPTSLWAPYENISAAAGVCSVHLEVPQAAEVDVLPCGARQLSKLKRFLTSIQQTAVESSADSAEQVRLAIWSLVNNKISAEEFVAHVQAANVPLKRFIIPFIKANLPHLQRELFLLSRHNQLMNSGTPESIMPAKGHFSCYPNVGAVNTPTSRGQITCGSVVNVPSSVMFPQLFHHLRTGREVHAVKGHRDSSAQQKLQLVETNQPDSIPLRLATLMQRISHLSQWYAAEKTEMFKTCASSPKPGENEECKKCWTQWLAMHNLSRMETENMTVELAALLSMTGQSDITSQIQKSIELLRNQLDLSALQMRDIEPLFKQRNSFVPSPGVKAEMNDADKKKDVAVAREPCWSCGKRARKMCAGCKKAKYCERECQENDWPVHGRNCKVATLLPARNL